MIDTDLQQAHFEEGEVIFREGEESELAYMLISGSVALAKTTQFRLSVAEIIREGFFGLLPMIDGLPRNYTATAREKTTCLVIPEEVLHKLLNQSDPMLKAIVNHLTRSLREASSRLAGGGVIDPTRGDNV